MNRVQIKNQFGEKNGTDVLIDGNIVPRVRSVDFHVAADEAPLFTFDVCGKPDIDIEGDVEFTFTPENLSDACFIISEELKRHGQFYDAFLESVKSSLKDGITWTPDELMDKKAEEIVKRISGEE